MFLPALQFPLAPTCAAEPVGPKVFPKEAAQPGQPERASKLAKADKLTTEALALGEQGRWQEALPLAEEALQINRAIRGEKHVHYAGSLCNLGYACSFLGDYPRAEALYRQAIECLEKAHAENHPFFAISLENLANCFVDQGDYARAEPLRRQVLEIRKRTLGENHGQYAKALENMANLCHNMGDEASAEPLHRQALDIFKKALGEAHPDYANTLNNLACLYGDQGDYARAEPLIRQAMEIRKKSLGEAHPGYANSLNNLAFLYGSQGDYARAQSLYRQALEIQKKIVGDAHPDNAAILINLGLLYEAQGDYARAEPFLRQAVAITRKHLESVSVVQSERQQLAMLRSVRGYLDACLAMAAENSRFAESAYCEMLAWKGVVLRRQRLARAAGETPELMNVFSRLQQVATQLAKLAWATPDPKQEANWRERIGKLSAEKERLEAELSSKSTASRQARHQVSLEELQAALPQDTILIDFLEYRHGTPPDKKAGTRETSQRRLLAFVVGRGRAVEIVPLSAVAPISEAIDTWREPFGMSPQGRAAGRLLRERIWEPIEPKLQGAKIVLVSPDGALGRLPLGALPGKEPGKYLLEEYTLALVPVPQLIPEIVNEQGRKPLRKNLLLLGNVDYDAVPDKPSLSGTTQGSPAALTGAGSTRFSRAPADGISPFNPLTGTQEEISLIERLYRGRFGPEGLARIEGDRATKRLFLAEAPEHRYLHVATHGFFAPENRRSALATAPHEPSRFSEMLQGEPSLQVVGLHPGLLSGLALTGANRAATAAVADDPDADDGILTAEEIGAANLDGVNLVTLSACETGLGKAAGGEGLLGLQRAFQSAGARTVVASLWRVDDAATRALMVEFYKNRWEKKLSKLEALRAAQRKILHEYDPKAGQLRGPGRVTPVDPAKLEAAPEVGQKTSPRYWAAFVLSGDWR
jgi:CHAT domain-containing protein/tetratricopeptide (TPR) repeat protein